MLNNKTSRRRVVYTVLSDYLANYELVEALWLWESEYSSKPMSNIKKFLSYLAKNNAINSNQVSIYRNLLLGLHNPEKIELKSDPMPLMLKLKNKNFVEVSKRTAEVSKRTVEVSKKIDSELIFISFIQCFIDEAEQYQSNFRKLLEKKTFDGLSKAQIDDFKGVITNCAGELKQNYNKPIMKNIVHVIYVEICNILGPVKADDCLAVAVKKVSGLSAAKSFSPRNLL